MIVPNDDYYGRNSYDDYEKPEPEQRADLITIHIYKDQIVKLTEDVIRWMFHKIKGAFRRKKQEKRKENAGQNKEKKQ